MALTLKFEHPHFPEGHRFAINFLGSVENGGSVELSDDDERTFIVSHGRTVEDAFANDALVSVSGSSALDKKESDELVNQVNPEEVAVEEDNNPNALIMGGGEDE